MFIAVLDKDCIPHYFINEINAQRYLVENANEKNCKLDLSNTQYAGELYNESGESIGYYYTPKLEDAEDIPPAISPKELKKKLLMEDKNIG